MYTTHPIDARVFDDTCATHILATFDAAPGAFRVPRHGDTIEWERHAAHAHAYAADPELYALAALREGTDAHRVQVLFQLLRADRSTLDVGERQTVEQVTAKLMQALPADAVLTALLALRRVRVNRAHASRAIASWVFGHPALAALVASRRPAVRDVLEHALGKAVARASLRAIASGDRAVRLQRLGVDCSDAAGVAAWLLRQGPAPEAQVALHSAHRPITRPEVPAPDTVTVTNRGAISAALVHAWRTQAPTEAHRDEVERALQPITAPLGPFDGRVAVVLDASASMAGYGDREHASASQAMALWLTLDRVVSDLHTVWVGGAVPVTDAAVEVATGLRAGGATDLATGLLDAVDSDPDVIVVITDGYESQTQGDLARVAAALPTVGVHTPVVVCTVAFSAADQVGHRVPAPELENHLFWHERDLGPLVLRLLCRAPLGRGEAFLRAAFRHDLEV